MQDYARSVLQCGRNRHGRLIQTILGEIVRLLNRRFRGNMRNIGQKILHHGLLYGSASVLRIVPGPLLLHKIQRILAACRQSRHIFRLKIRHSNLHSLLLFTFRKIQISHKKPGRCAQHADDEQNSEMQLLLFHAFLLSEAYAEAARRNHAGDFSSAIIAVLRSFDAKQPVEQCAIGHTVQPFLLSSHLIRPNSSKARGSMTISKLPSRNAVPSFTMISEA